MNPEGIAASITSNLLGVQLYMKRRVLNTFGCTKLHTVNHHLRL